MQNPTWVKVVAGTDGTQEVKWQQPSWITHSIDSYNWEFQCKWTVLVWKKYCSVHSALVWDIETTQIPQILKLYFFLCNPSVLFLGECNPYSNCTTRRWTFGKLCSFRKKREMQCNYHIADNPLHQKGKSEARSWIP